MRASREAGIARLYCLGAASHVAGDTFGDAAAKFTEVEDLLRQLRADLHPGISVLIKGSRCMGLDRVVRELVPDASQDGEGKSQ